MVLFFNKDLYYMEDNEATSRIGGRMKIALFGASGGTGRLLTERCLAAGYDVTALVRRPEEFAYAGRVRVVEGTAFDAEAVRRTVTGTDMVLSALGARSLKKEDVLERAVPLIVSAMKEAGVRRIIVLGSAGALEDSLKKQPAWRRWFVQKIVYNTFLKWAVASQIDQWKVLSASGLDFTMVMPPMLMNSAGRGTYRIDGEALPRHGARIAREDVADFMMDQIEGVEWVGKGVYVAW
jgi:putative NADH-flavin reductase